MARVAAGDFVALLRLNLRDRALVLDYKITGQGFSILARLSGQMTNRVIPEVPGSYQLLTLGPERV